MTEPATEQPKQLAPIAVVRNQLTNMAPEFRAALPAHIAPEKFVRTAQTAISLNPALMDCDRKSLFAACMKAAQDGLVLDGREAALVQFGNQVQYMPMVAGLMKKARNSGEIAMLDAQIVHANDKFTYRPGIDELPAHEPDWFGARGEPIGVYAFARTKDGAAYVEILSKVQVEKIRATSRAKNGPAWTQWWDEMWRKSAIRRMSKRLPSSADRDGDEFQRTVERDDEMYDVTNSVAPEVPAPKMIDAALEAAAEESGRAGDSSPSDPTPEAKREGTDSAATPDEPLDPKACRALICTLDADALASWQTANEAKIQKLAPTARQIIRAAVADRKTVLGEPK